MVDGLAIATKQKWRDKCSVGCTLNCCAQRGHKVLEEDCIVVQNSDIVDIMISLEHLAALVVAVCITEILAKR